MTSNENGKTFMEETRDGIRETNKILGNHVLTALAEERSILDTHTVLFTEIRDALRTIAENGIVVQSREIDLD